MEKSKETKMQLGQYNLQDILEPLVKASGGSTARSQYLSVSRYVAGQEVRPSANRRRKDSDISLLSTSISNGRRELFKTAGTIISYKKKIIC